MKYVNYLKDIDHVLVYPLTVLILFASLFLFILIRTFSANREEMHHFGRLPLDKEENRQGGSDKNKTPII